MYDLEFVVFHNSLTASDLTLFTKKNLIFFSLSVSGIKRAAAT